MFLVCIQRQELTRAQHMFVFIYFTQEGRVAEAAALAAGGGGAAGGEADDLEEDEDDDMVRIMRFCMMLI